MGHEAEALALIQDLGGDVLIKRIDSIGKRTSTLEFLRSDLGP